MCRHIFYNLSSPICFHFVSFRTQMHSDGSEQVNPTASPPPPEKPTTLVYVYACTSSCVCVSK